MKLKEIVTTIVVAAIFIIYLYFASVITSQYTKEAIVIDTTNETVIVEDSQGYVWEFYGENFSKKDKVVLTFNNKNTSTIFDDEIIKVKKTGKIIPRIT